MAAATGPAFSAGMPMFDEFPFFSAEFQSLPPEIQAGLRQVPSNSETYPVFQFPRPPSLHINVMTGADWRLDDGYGLWMGDAHSPLATAADYSAYDKAQNGYFMHNRDNFSKFNTAFRKSALNYAKAYRKEVSSIVRSNQQFQDLLLTYPQAVTKNYVLMYLQNRDYNLGDLRRSWGLSVSKIKRSLGDTLGLDLNALDINYVKSGLDPYVRNINLELIDRERSIIDNSWAPLEENALAPLDAFKPNELTIAEAEKMQWGLPPVSRISPTRPATALPPAPTPEQELGQAFRTVVAGGEAPKPNLLLQWLALLILAGAAVFYWMRKSRKRKTSSGEEQGPATD